MAVESSKRVVRDKGDRSFTSRIIFGSSLESKIEPRERNRNWHILPDIRYLPNEVKDRVAELRNSYWDKLLEDIEPSHTAFWWLARGLKAES